VTDALLVAARAVHYAGCVELAGVAGFLLLIGEPALRHNPRGVSPGAAVLRRRLLFLAWASLGIALVSGTAWVWAQAAAMSGRPLGEALDTHILGIVLSRTRFGHVFLLRLGFAGLAAVALAVLGRRSAAKTAGIALLAGAACLLAALAWVGHAAAEPGLDGDIHLAADTLHLLATGAWLGGLLPLALFFAAARHGGDQGWAITARTATQRFSIMGIASVGTLLATGLVNTWYLAGTIPALVGTPYGHLLLIKVALFLAMVAVAAVNRLRLTPRLSHVPRGSRQRSSWQAMAQLRRNSLIEAALGLAILVIVGALGTMIPGLHQQPWWPFPFRFSTEAFETPALRGEVLIACAAIVLGLLLVVAAIGLRRLWWSLLVVGIVLLAFFVPSLRLLAERAYPTSFDQSPTGYTARSIVVGERQFAQTCAACHGAQGRGDGPLAASLSIRPADLTAPHIYAHADGDLFWWISHGIHGTPMPAFADRLDQRTRWSLIDFIHANADGRRLSPLASGTFPSPAPAPDFSADCPDGSTVTLGELRGRVVHLVFAGPDLAPRLDALRRLDLGRDVATIVVAPHAAAAETAPFCTVLSPDVVTAYALFRSGKKDALAGAEFLVDTAGWLRALWQPGPGAGWRDPATLRKVIASIRQPLAEARPAGHHHH
jgi:putative copper resistance protein D